MSRPFRQTSGLGSLWLWRPAFCPQATNSVVIGPRSNWRPPTLRSTIALQSAQARVNHDKELLPFRARHSRDAGRRHGNGHSFLLGQVPLTAYADKDGYVDVQKLTCAQLAGTFQEDADLLAAWYSGWYNGLAKAHRAKISRIKSDEHKVIVFCKANPGMTIIQAIDIVFKNRRN